jgi:hypothetical protein
MRADEQTARYWVGQSKQEYTWRKRSGKRFTLTLNRGHEGCIREVLQEDSCSSMYKDIAMQLSTWKELAWTECIVCMLPWLLCNALLSRTIELSAVLIIIVLTAMITCNTLLSRSIELSVVSIIIISLPWLSYDALFASYYWITDCCLFSQVKNKPWIPWVNTWIRHCREYWLCPT